ncbi:hypothetical protein L596_000275 [Steinernema carpocapsae]|uniref:EGF-like domain-containing protein n=1 Tax=Steinernema carpocapsae TaxID=34508 RepID=A0A4U8UII2_STECR|nr:hypothetical protein L596_000275 [Steinernema carpocapsae]
MVSNCLLLCVFITGLQHGAANLGPTCGREDCNLKGNCLGLKTAPLCFCDPGYLGLRCEESPCDGVVACNGNGLCIGTNLRSTCLCNLGYTGDRCQFAPDTRVPQQTQAQGSDYNYVMNTTTAAPKTPTTV